MGVKRNRLRHRRQGGQSLGTYGKKRKIFGTFGRDKIGP